MNLEPRFQKVAAMLTEAKAEVKVVPDLLSVKRFVDPFEHRSGIPAPIVAPKVTGSTPVGHPTFKHE